MELKTWSNKSKLYLQVFFFTTLLVLVWNAATLQSFIEKKLYLDCNKCCDAFLVLKYELSITINYSWQVWPIHARKKLFSCLLMFCFSLYALKGQNKLLFSTFCMQEAKSVFSKRETTKTNTTYIKSKPKKIHPLRF